MLTKLEMVNFKCFEKQELPLRALTMLTGLNSAGKSTVLQAMLLLRQSHQDRILEKVGLTLDGYLVQLGTARDILFEGAKEEVIDLGLSWDNGDHARYNFTYDQSAEILSLASSDVAGSLENHSLFSDRFHYLEAERIGPRAAFEMSEFEVQRHRQLGTAGEFASHFMALFGTTSDVSELMHHPLAKAQTLREEVEAWMSEISPGLRLHFRVHQTMDLANFNVSFVSAGEVSTNERRPGNVGFGITYTLPIVISLLSAKPGHLVLLENPEAHLHPRAQSKIGELIARTAASGVQVIFETHSDHVLNGVRMAVKDKKLEADDASILFFDRGAGSLRARVTPLQMDADGRIDQWPVGFFDEFEKSIERLI